MQHDPVLLTLTFDLLTGSGAWGSAGKIFATMLLHFLIPFYLICNMTMFLKKLNFELLTPALRLWGRGVFLQNMYYHVAAFMVPLNLICNMTLL